MKTVCISFALLFTAGIVAAQDAPEGVRGEILQQLGAWENQIVSLSEAAPEELFDWKPAEGVRSFGQAALHVAGAMYYMTGLVGATLPEGVNPMELESSATDKASIIQAVKTAFGHARSTVMGLSDEQFEQKTTWFMPGEVTYRGILTFMNAHNAEHLGQLVAYGRMNGLVPPWSN